jgi:hypothetical protein
MQRTLTFYDFAFRARHALKGRAETAAHPHWHSYVVRFWFDNAPDQDALSEIIEPSLRHVHACDLAILTPESTDEGLARYFLALMVAHGCVRVLVTNDSRRGAEASL